MWAILAIALPASALLAASDDPRPTKEGVTALIDCCIAAGGLRAARAPSFAVAEAAKLAAIRADRFE